MQPGATAYAVLFVGQLAIGSAALFARVGLGAGLSAPALSAWRLTVAALVLAVLPRARESVGAREPTSASGAPAGRARLRLILAGICLGAHFTTWFASLARIPVARSTLLVTTSPVFSGLAGRLLGTPIAGRFWVGLAIALVGAAGVIGPEALGGGALGGGARCVGALSGDLYALAGAALMAAYLLLVEDLQVKLTTRRVMTWTCSTAAGALWVGVLASGGAAWPGSARAWVSILGMALVPQLVGHSALNWSLRHFPAGIVGAATLLEPVFAAGLAWVIYAETLTAIQLGGAAVLLAGVALAITGGPPAAATVPAPLPAP